jgi:dGTPase
MDWKILLSSERIRKSTPNDARNEFESDYGRIIYSPALRRMHDKTQVFPLTTDDNIHSRLTHSNEVMSLGYTFGLLLSKSDKIKQRTDMDELRLLRVLPILLQNVCLVHDIGNAPFGHFGETIVSDYFKRLDADGHPNFKNLTERQKRDFFNYDGNAQGLRVLTKLQYLDNPFGLNLTFATLASYLKYPNFQEINDNVEAALKKVGQELKDKQIAKSKHGVFFSEEKYFSMIVDECGLKKGDIILRHPLCFLMEAADSIAYLCMDMEDGFNKGLFDIVHIRKVFDESSAIISRKVVAICDDDSMNPTTQMVNIRILLISYLVNLAFANFEKNLELIENGEYNLELIKDDSDKINKLIQKFSVEKIFSSREINHLESTGYSVFKGLLDFYISFLFHNNKKYVQRAKSLISKSTINAAIEENLIAICDSKLQRDLADIINEKSIFKSNEKYLTEINQKELYQRKKIEEFKTLQQSYIALFQKQLSEDISKQEQRELRTIKNKINDLIQPGFEDLDDYFKFRIILDFISGMTDQFALNHYQKLSGQKIS